MNFPEQLKAQRERLGLTQAELAAFLDVSPRAVWQWEQGTLPHVLTQEGALARLSKAKRRTQGTNRGNMSRETRLGAQSGNANATAAPYATR